MFKYHSSLKLPARICSFLNVRRAPFCLIYSTSDLHACVHLNSRRFFGDLRQGSWHIKTTHSGACSGDAPMSVFGGGLGWLGPMEIRRYTGCFMILGLWDGFECLIWLNEAGVHKQRSEPHLLRFGQASLRPSFSIPTVFSDLVSLSSFIHLSPSLPTNLISTQINRQHGLSYQTQRSCSL